MTKKKQDINQELSIFKSNNLFKDFVDNSINGAAAEIDNKIVYVNKAFLDIFGYSKKKEVLGKSPYDFIPNYERTHLKRVFHELQEKKKYKGEFSALKKDGTRLIIEISIHLVHENQATYMTFIDMTECKVKSKQLIKNQRKYKKFIENVMIGIYSVDYNGMITGMNKYFAEIFGYKNQKELLGKPSWEMAVPEKQEITRQIFIRKSREQDSSPVEIECTGKNGEIIWVEITLNTHNESGHLFGTAKDITEKKERAAKKKREENRFRFIFDNVENIAVQGYYHNGIVHYWNKASEKIYGYSAKEAIGKKLYDLIIPAKAVPFVKKNVEKMFETGKPNPAEELTLKKKDGSFVTVYSNHTIIKRPGKHKELYCIDIDLTSKKAAENQLRSSEAKYKAIIQNMQDIYFRVDVEGIIKMISPSALKIFGHKSLDNILEKNIQEFCPQTDNFFKLLKEKNSIYNFEQNMINNSGKEINTLISAQYFIDRSHGKEWFEGIITDFTSKKELQDQLYHSQKMDSIGQLAAGISHDFNNLLTVINGYSEILINEDLKKENIEMLKAINNAGEKAQKLTNQLLTFSRKQIISPIVFDINEEIRNSHKMLQRIISEDIEIKFKLQKNIPNIKLDPTQLNQIIINLSVNAKDAMPNGGSLEISTGTIKLPNKEKFLQDFVHLSISDSGEGMDKEIQNKVFEPFFTTKDKGKGTGLGLSTVYGIIKQNNGKIKIESVKGKGTVINIFFPVSEEIIEDEITEEISLCKNLSEKKIFVVEDEKEVRFFLEKILKNAGYQTYSAPNPKEAIKIFPNLNETIDLLITDVIMPHMNGADMHKKLTDHNNDLKVLFVSGYPSSVISDHTNFQENMKLITKPIDRKKFLLTIQSILKN